MDEKDFEMAAEMADVGAETRIYTAAKIVMVDGMSRGHAARECGITVPAVSVAVKRITKVTTRALELAECMNKKGKK